MNASRLVAAVAALAIGFGVTLVGVAIADDEASVRVETQESDDPPAPSQDDELRQVDVEDTDAPDTNAPDTNVSEASPPLPASSLPLETTPPTTADSLPDEPPTDTKEFEDVKCVETISVVYADGGRADYVVLETLDASSFLVLDVDGEFEVSARDADVEELVLVSRNVRFFQGAAINFLDVCADLGGDEGTLGDDIESIRTDFGVRHTYDIDQNGAL